MNQSFLMRVLLSVLALSLSLGSAMSQDAVKDKEAAEKFALVKSKLPEVVKKAVMGRLEPHIDQNGAVAVQLARRIGPAEGKVTIRISVKRPDNTAEDEVALLVIYLGFFEGQWTSTRLEGDWSHHSLSKNPAYQNRLNHLVMLAIDKITEK